MVVLALAVMVAPAPVSAATATGRDVRSARDARSNDELAQDLVERFLDLLVGETDVEGLRELLSPAFLRQGADGTSSTKSEYLESTPAVIASYTIQDLEATRSGPVLVARYDVVTSETLGGGPAKTEPAPRLTVFVKGKKGWQVIAHSNFNAPASAPAT
jgi:hypothetical protein